MIGYGTRLPKLLQIYWTRPASKPRSALWAKRPSARLCSPVNLTSPFWKLRLPLEPDVTWLYGADRPEAYSLLDQIAGPTMTGYDLWIGRLTASLDLVALVPGHDKTALLYNLYETDARSVWSCLLFRQSAVLYGDRVIGQCKPVRQNPYNGVEELWIWPGRSS